jgi:hypothetical protein
MCGQPDSKDTKKSALCGRGSADLKSEPLSSFASPNYSTNILIGCLLGERQVLDSIPSPPLSDHGLLDK